MHKLLIITFLIIGSTLANAQIWVNDQTIEEHLMTNDDQIKVLYFTASWCGPCRMMKPIVASIHNDTSLNINIYKMDVDANGADDLLKVTSIPTYFFMKNGRVLGTKGSVMSREKLIKVIKDYDDSNEEGELFLFNGKPSKYTIVVGAHHMLSAKNIKGIWYDTHQLNKVAWGIYKKLENPKDILCGVRLSERSIEIEPFASNYETLAHLLDKQGKKEQALQAAIKSKEYAIKEQISTAIIDALMEKLNSES